MKGREAAEEHTTGTGVARRLRDEAFVEAQDGADPGGYLGRSLFLEFEIRRPLAMCMFREHYSGL